MPVHIPYDWIVGPEFAAGDWPARELRGRLFPVPLALRQPTAPRCRDR